MSSDPKNASVVLSLVKDDAAASASLDPAGRPYRTLDWSIFMARAQAGDRDAYRRLLEEITPYLRALAVRHVQNRADAEDAVQDTLLTIHAVRHTYDPLRPFAPWLVTIANRRIIDGLRRRGRIGAREVPLENEHETFSAPETNFHEKASDGRALREALERLSPGQREAIRMLKIDQMTLKEAARASGMSAAALKVATHRALKNLRKIFGNQDRKT